MKTSKAISLYNILKGLKIGRLQKEEQFKIIRNARALKAVASEFDDFLADARTRLRPEGFNQVEEMAARFDSLSDDDKQAVNRDIAAYNAKVEECVRTELERDRDIDTLQTLLPDSLPILAETNDLNVEAILTLEDM